MIELLQPVHFYQISQCYRLETKRRLERRLDFEKCEIICAVDIQLNDF